MALLNLSPTAGTPADLLARLKSMLPAGWFADSTPVLDALLGGIAAACQPLFALLAITQAQTRLATATDIFLDLYAQDFCGTTLRRAPGETDASLRARIAASLARARITRSAVAGAVTALTGTAPTIVEPARIADTGAYNTSLAWNTAGVWGSLALPFQAFVHVAPTNVPPSQIAAAIATTMPAGTVAWVAIG